MALEVLPYNRIADEWFPSLSLWEASGGLTAEAGALVWCSGGVGHCTGVASLELCYVMFGLQRGVGVAEGT